MKNYSSKKRFVIFSQLSFALINFWHDTNASEKKSSLYTLSHFHILTFIFLLTLSSFTNPVLAKSFLLISVYFFIFAFMPVKIFGDAIKKDKRFKYKFSIYHTIILMISTLAWSIFLITEKSLLMPIQFVFNLFFCFCFSLLVVISISCFSFLLTNGSVFFQLYAMILAIITYLLFV